MKKIPLISFLFCAIIGLVLIGCEQPEPGPDPEQSDITIGHVPVIPVEGGTFEVDIQYNTEFTVEVEESAQSWNEWSCVEYHEENGTLRLVFNGAYRPSQNSMIRDNLEYFNAPSRWAIYKRIMELSGESYSFETFLDYDKVNRL